MAHDSGGLPLPLFGLTKTLLDDAGGQGVSFKAWPFITLFCLFVFNFALFAFEQTVNNFSLLLFLAPLWVPPILLNFAFARYLETKRSLTIAETKHVLLELRMPRDTRKSPQAMETVFSGLHLSPGESTWWKKMVLGRTRPWWSFEIVSLGGRVRFFVWTRENMRPAVESQLYAQYPGIEIVEAADYSRLVHPGIPPHTVWGVEYIHGKPDPYPIKTYIDFGLDKNLKPEEQVDPLAQIIETIGSIGPKEQIWIQMIIRVSKNEKHNGKVNKEGKPYTWKDEAQEEIEKIRKKAVVTVETEEGTSERQLALTKGQAEIVAAMERTIGKLAFDVGIRAIYTAPEDASRPMGLLMGSVFKPVNTENLNSIKSTRWSDWFSDFPWEDPGNKRKTEVMKHLVYLYRRRAYFHPPYRASWMTMSTEELATLFHVPSSTVSTPSMPRIQSATKEAPSNLPT